MIDRDALDDGITRIAQAAGHRCIADETQLARRRPRAERQDEAEADLEIARCQNLEILGLRLESDDAVDRVIGLEKFVDGDAGEGAAVA